MRRGRVSDKTAGANCANVLAGGTVPATGWLLRTETWHCPQQSREENAGPDVSPCDMCPCDLRQQLAFFPLQQQGGPLASWANRNAPSASANQRANREGIVLIMRLNRPRTSTIRAWGAMLLSHGLLGCVRDV